MRFAYKATRPDFMKDKAQWIWACSSRNCSTHKDIYNRQELRKALPLIRSPSNSLGVAGFNPRACIWRVEFISVGAGVLRVMTGFSGVRISFKPGMFCNNWRMSPGCFFGFWAFSLPRQARTRVWRHGLLLPWSSELGYYPWQWEWKRGSWALCIGDKGSVRSRLSLSRI